jgi:hypothetical protein
MTEALPPGTTTEKPVAVAKKPKAAPPVVPEKSTQSPLLHYVSGRVEGMEMPPLPRRDKFAAFTKDEVERIRTWIDQGADWPKDVVITPPRLEKSAATANDSK